jgi:hypothetical protein
MCRNIKQLRGLDDGPTDEQLRLAALQYVRKVTGYRSSSKANAEAFDRAVAEIAESTRILLSSLVIRDRPAPAADASPSHVQELPAARSLR